MIAVFQPTETSARRRNGRWRDMLLAITVGWLISQPAFALSYFPERIILDDQHRSTVLRIVNKDDVPRRYIITWQRMRMTPERGLRPVPEGDPAPELNPARDHVLFAPRQAVVHPNGTQAVRLMARVPADLPPGEYRSHLMITETPRERQMRPGDKKGDGVRMQIKVVHRTTLPVILRHGDPKAAVAAEAMRIRRSSSGPRLDVVLGRAGESSVYADATVTWEAPDGERHRVFGPATLAIYPELDRRRFSHPLTPPAGKMLDGGTLHYVLKDHPPHGGPTPVLVDRRLRVR